MQHSTFARIISLSIGLAVAAVAYGNSRGEVHTRGEGVLPAVAGQDSGCYVHLFDDENFENENIMVKGPGRFANLSNLPGTNKDWTDEAGSFKVGPSATVQIWTETNFEGRSRTYQPGSQVSDVDDEPESMVITC